MVPDDLERFTIFMNQLAEVCKEKDPPSDDKIKGYFILLMDMEFDDILANAYESVKHGENWFPSPMAMRGEDKLEYYADQAYMVAKQILADHFYPDFPATSLKVVRRKLNDVGLGGYFDIVNEFGLEMLNGDNPTATRAQFRRAFKSIATVGKMRELPEFLKKAPKQINAHSNEPKALASIAKKILAKNEDD